MSTLRFEDGTAQTTAGGAGGGGYGSAELGQTQVNPPGGVSYPGSPSNTTVNLKAGSLLNNTNIIALNDATVPNNANKAIVTDGAGVLSWSDANLVPTRSGQTDGYVLTVDSSTTPNSMKWAAGGGGSVHYFSAATVDTEQTFPFGTNVQLELQVQSHNATDLNSVWVQSTNLNPAQTAAYSYVIPETGVWQIRGSLA